MTSLRGGEGWVNHLTGVRTIPAGTHTFLFQGAFGDSGGIGTEAHMDDFEIRIVSPEEAIPKPVCVEVPKLPAPTTTEEPMPEQT